MTLDASHKAFCALRRICRNWRLADARSANYGTVKDAEKKRRRRIISARRMLRCNKLGQSASHGVSEWIPLDVSLTAAYWCMASHPMPEVDDSRYQIEI